MIPPPAPLVLVAAAFSEDETLTLTFDRAISVAGLDGTQVVVDDADLVGNRYDASGGSVTVLSPASVRLAMTVIGLYTQSGVHLTASASSGIVAVDDGGTWAGVTDLALPFP